MTNATHIVFGAISVSDKGGFSGNANIDGYPYKVTAPPDIHTSEGGAQFQTMTFVAQGVAPFATASVFRSKTFFDMVDKPGIQLMVNFGPDRELIRLTGFRKITKKDGTPSKTPYFSLRASRPNPKTLEVTSTTADTVVTEPQKQAMSIVTPELPTVATATTPEVVMIETAPVVVEIKADLIDEPAVEMETYEVAVVSEMAGRGEMIDAPIEQAYDERDLSLVYDDEDCNLFVQRLREAGFEPRHYEGRFSWTGPSVVVKRSSGWDIDVLTAETGVDLQQDSMGMDVIVYPVSRGTKIEHALAA